jgi:hypothetical protein
MVDRYQDKPFPADDDDDRGGDPRAPDRGESDPLAELARLIGQTDPFAMSRANQPVQPRSVERDRHQPPAAASDDGLPTGPPPWMMQRHAEQEAPPQEYPSAVHPLRRYATPVAPPEPDYQEPQYTDAEPEHDPSRYDEALYGQLDSGAEVPEHDPAYADDAYADQDGYGEAAEEPVRKRRGGLVTVAAVLALAVIGTGAAFAYRTYVRLPRTAEPPIIKADAAPTKIVPAPADASAKVPDRLAAGDGTEKIVPREEAPVDVNSKTGARVVFPPLNQNSNPPPLSSVATASPPPPGAGNGTLPNNEPRKIKTLSVRGDAADPAATPVGSAPPPAGSKPAPAGRTSATSRNPPSSANASANAPLSLTPQGGQASPAATRIAATNPVQIAPPTPPAAPSSAGGSGGYLVQVSSQRNEADAQASYRALQSKFPAVLGSHTPVIKRADLGDKGVYYRAMVGPFGSPDEATQFCGSLKTAGGQCVVQRN